MEHGCLTLVSTLFFRVVKDIGKYTEVALSGLYEGKWMLRSVELYMSSNMTGKSNGLSMRKSSMYGDFQ